MIPEFLQCTACKHFVRGACAAFPDAIPIDIATDQHDHRQPYEGDHGIRWEPSSPGVKHPMEDQDASR